MAHIREAPPGVFLAVVKPQQWQCRMRWKPLSLTLSQRQTQPDTIFDCWTLRFLYRFCQLALAHIRTYAVFNLLTEFDLLDLAINPIFFLKLSLSKVYLEFLISMSWEKTVLPEYVFQFRTLALQTGNRSYRLQAQILIRAVFCIVGLLWGIVNGRRRFELERLTGTRQFR